jgi:hypothetical protein
MWSGETQVWQAVQGDWELLILWDYGSGWQNGFYRIVNMEL